MNYWYERFERVLSVWKVELITEEDLKKFQLFLLDTGHFNANFNIEELERLEYPKSPFSIMKDHAYLRATNTWAMQMLSIKYCDQEKHINLCPIWVDSKYFRKELKRYNRVVEREYLVPIIEEIKANDGKLINTWWFRIDKPTNLPKDIKEIMVDIKEEICNTICDDIRTLYNAEKLNLIKEKLICFFKDEFKIDAIFDMEAIVVVETRYPYKLINSLGYRINSTRAISNVLALYRKLFVEEEDTNKFWNQFKITDYFTTLPKNEQNCIEKIFAQIKLRLSVNLCRFIPSTFEKERKLLLKKRLPKEFLLYANYLTKYLKDYTKRNKPSRAIRYVADPEIQLALKIFLKSTETGNLKDAILASQIITEVMQLDLKCTPLKESFGDAVMGKLLEPYKKRVQGVTITPYAMRAFVRVLQILNPQPATKIFVTNQSYYELLENFERLNAHTSSVELIRQVDDIDESADIIFLDIHPNNVVESRQYAHNALQLLESINSWAEKKQRTLVFDVTLNVLQDEEVRNLLSKASQQIDSGYLNIILIQSLTKFAQLGLDKLSAGLIILINNGRDWKCVNEKFQTISNAERIDIAIDHYFTYFAKFSGLLKQYISLVNRNVREVYGDILQRMNSLETFSHNRFQITMSADPKACYIAINMRGLLPEVELEETFHSFMINGSRMEEFPYDLLEHMVYPLCEFYALPITSRNSVGFPLTSVNVVYDSLRFTIGLESSQQRKGYAEILSYTAFVINRQRYPQIFFYRSQDQKAKTGGYDLRIRYFNEKVAQFKAMTSGRYFNTWVVFDSRETYKTSSGERKLPITIYFNNGRITGKWETTPYDPKPTEVPFSDIKASIRGSGPVSVTKLSCEKKKMIAGCFTQVICPGKDLDQNVNHSIYSLKKVLALPSFQVLELWNTRILYGPFLPKSNKAKRFEQTELLFILYQKKITLVWNDKLFNEEAILVRQGSVDIPLTDLPIEDRAFLIQEGAYDSCKQNQKYWKYKTNIQFKPTTENSMKFYDKEGKLVIKHDKLCCRASGVSVFSRALGKDTTCLKDTACFEVDFWGEKDHIVARFLRLMTAVYVKEQYQKSFKARDSRFTHFIFDLKQAEGKHLFEAAVQVIMNRKTLLIETFSKRQKYIRDKKEQYIFGNPLSWPSNISNKGSDLVSISSELKKNLCNLIFDNTKEKLERKKQAIAGKGSLEVTEDVLSEGLLNVGLSEKA